MKLVGLLIDDSRRVIARAAPAGYEVVAELDEFWAAPDSLSVAATREVVAADDAVMIPPVPHSARVICVGLNYRAHADEGVFDVAEYPTLFGRWTASLSVSDTEVRVPTGEAGLDWEGEVAAFVGAPLKDVTADEARSSVFGYAAFNDLTARRAQKLTTQWTLGKNGDRTGPLGPIVTIDDVGDLRDGLRVTTRVNGAVVQEGNTADMVFEVGEILALISRTFRLNPGDVIATGTPDGVGYVRNPPWLLGDGDVVEVDIDRLGVVRTPVVAS